MANDTQGYGINKKAQDVQGLPQGGKRDRPRAKNFEYVTQRGDNPATLAQRFYGDQRLLTEILKVWDGVQAGVSIKLPDLKKYQQDLKRRGETHYFAPGLAQSLGMTWTPPNAGSTGSPPTTTPTVNLQNPPVSGLSSTIPGQQSQLQTYQPPITNVAPTNYSNLATQRPGAANPSSRTRRPTGITYPASSVRPNAIPPLQGSNPAQPGAATGYYTGIGNQPYSQSTYTPEGPVDVYNPAFTTRPLSKTAGGNVVNMPGNQQQNVTAGMTPAQQAAALETGITPKPLGTYQAVQGGQIPIYGQINPITGKPTIIGWEQVSGETVNVTGPGFQVVRNADGTWSRVPLNQVGAMVGWTGDPMGKWQPGTQKIISGGEGYKDYLPAGPPRPPGSAGSPTVSGGGGRGGGGYGGRGGGGGGNPRGGGGRGVPGNRYNPPSYAQSSSLPGGARNPGRDMAGLSRTGLVTWRL